MQTYLFCDEVLRSARPPVTVFGRSAGRRQQLGSEEPMCGAAVGGRLVIDPAGRCHGCSMWVDSMQHLHGGLLTETFDRLRLGEISGSEVADRLRRLPSIARRCDVLMGKGMKHSCYGECSSCLAAGDCLVCPVSIGHIPGNRDPHRVSDLQCAFNRVVAAAQQELWSGQVPDDGATMGS